MWNATYAWPEGKTAAVMVSIDVDADTPLLWRTRDGPNQPFISELEQRQHGLRGGLGGILRVLAGHRVRATFFVPSIIAEQNPALLPALVAQGHEVGLHGHAHEAVRDISDADFSRALDRSMKVLEAQTGRRPLGFRSPGWEMTQHMLRELRRHELYDSSLAGMDVPYTIGGVTEVPVSWSREDTTRFKFTGNADRWAPTSPKLVLEEWMFDWRATSDAGGLFVLTLHDWIAGRPAPLFMLDQFLQLIISSPSAWVATGFEIAAHHRGLHRDGN